MKRLKNFFCSLAGHKFRESFKVTDHISEYRCSCCGKEVTDSADGYLTELTQQFRETNLSLAEVYQRRSMHRTRLNF